MRRRIYMTTEDFTIILMSGVVCAGCFTENQKPQKVKLCSTILCNGAMIELLDNLKLDYEIITDFSVVTEVTVKTKMTLKELQKIYSVFLKRKRQRRWFIDKLN